MSLRQRKLSESPELILIRFMIAVIHCTFIRTVNIRKIVTTILTLNLVLLFPVIIRKRYFQNKTKIWFSTSENVVHIISEYRGLAFSIKHLIIQTILTMTVDVVSHAWSVLISFRTRYDRYRHHWTNHYTIWYFMYIFFVFGIFYPKGSC